MNMTEVVDLLSKIILLTIIGTIVLAVLTYVAYRIRSARKGPKKDADAAGQIDDVEYVEPMLFEKYSPVSDQEEEK